MNPARLRRVEVFCEFYYNDGEGKGQLSRIYSNTDKHLVDDRVADTYILVPEAFQQKYGFAIHGCEV